MEIKKNEKGITIISLIITIIILVILAVISIKAISDGNILDKSIIAEETYSEEQEKEKVKLAVNQAIIDGANTINKESLNIALTEQFNDNFEFTEETVDYFKIKIKPSKRIYKISKDGTIEKINGWTDNGNNSFTKGNRTLKIGEILTKDQLKKIIEENKENIIEEGGIKYEGNWEVIGIENEKIKLVSIDNVANQKLGYGEEIFNEKDENGESKIIIEDTNRDGDLDLEKSAYSYAYAEETLNKKALEATGIKTARSITLDDIYNIIGVDSLPKSTNDYGTKYKFYTNNNGSVYYQKWDNDSKSWLDGVWAQQQFTYVNSKKQTKTFGKLDDNTKVKSEEDVIITYTWFNSDFNDEQLKKVGKNIAKGSYWFASKSIGGYSSYATFNIRYLEDNKHFRNFKLFSSAKEKGSTEKGIRAIIFI